MLEEIKSPIDQRFLMILGQLNNDMIRELEFSIIPEWLEKMRNRLDASVRAAYEKFTNRDKTIDAAYFTLYAYADIKLGRNYNWLFQKMEPTMAIDAKCTIDHAIYEGWFPTIQIEHGHKHILFINFENEAPKCIPLFKNWEDIGRMDWEYGLCDHETFNAING